MLADFFKLSLNNLRRRKLRSWLTLLGIFIGIAAVVALISLGQGLQTAITGQFASMGTDKLTIENSGTGFGPPGSTVIKKLNEHDIKVIEGIRGVKTVTPILLRMVKVEYNNYVSFEMVRSAPENSESLESFYKEQSLEAETGRLLKLGDNKKVVLGNSYLKKTKFDKALNIGKKIKIEGEEFEVVGILKSSGTFLLNDAIIMFYSDVEDILNINNEIDIIGLSVESSEDPVVVADRIEKEIRNDRGEKEGEEDFSVQTPLEAISAVNNILNAVNIVVIGIAMISLIVGGIGIANTMYTSVLERNKEIGTMKAIGARNSNILMIFIIESGLLGLVGGIIGVTFGSLLALGVGSVANSFFENRIITVNISVWLVIGSVVFSFLIGIFSGIIPSYQASKLKPVDALRG